MTNTPILGIVEVASNQNQIEVTINDGFVAIENATQANLAVSLASGNAATLSNAQFRGSFMFNCSGQTGPATLTVPLITRVFAVNNLDASSQITVGGATGATAVVPVSTTAILICDGTNVLPVTSVGTGSSTPVALTDAATIAVDFNRGKNFKVTLGGNRTLGNPSNIVAGKAGQIVITQDATGSRTLAFGSNWKFPSGVAPVLTTTAGAIDVISYYVADSTHILVSTGLNFA